MPRTTCKRLCVKPAGGDQADPREASPGREESSRMGERVALPLRRVAWHEAGHAVVAWAFGFQLGPITVVAGEKFDGRAQAVPSAAAGPHERAVVMRAGRPAGVQSGIEPTMTTTSARLAVFCESLVLSRQDAP